MTTNKVCGKGKCKFTDEFCASGDCPYDTENVAQANSQDLTEQWKKGELVQEDYYLKDNKYTFIDYFNGVSFEETCDFEIKEVLAEVPSYEEWQPFTDPYFRGLTTKDIAELAKKSIRLTTQHCEDNARIEKLEELLKEWIHYYPIILYEYEDTLKTKDIVELFDKTREALK